MTACSRIHHRGHITASFPSADVAHCRAARGLVQVLLPNRRFSWQECWHTLCSAGCSPEPAPPLANEPSQNWLVPPSKGLLPPKQMGTNVSVPGSKHVHPVGAPNKRFVSHTWHHLVQTAKHTAVSYEVLRRNYSRILILGPIN